MYESRWVSTQGARKPATSTRTMSAARPWAARKSPVDQRSGAAAPDPSVAPRPRQAIFTVSVRPTATAPHQTARFPRLLRTRTPATWSTEPSITGRQGSAQVGQPETDREQRAVDRARQGEQDPERQQPSATHMGAPGALGGEERDRERQQH